MKKFIILLFTLISFYSSAQEYQITYQVATSAYPEEESLLNEEIEWGFFTVPEEWGDPNSKKINLASARLKNRSNSKESNPVVMIDGGPGGASIEGLWWWLNHPLREKNDIILIDARGTGFSSPRLCPDLGNEFLKILAKNQSPSEDEEEKVLASLACKQKLIGAGINVNAYNSKNIAKDLHAIKEYYKYESWNVYSVSYGTYVAQVYANEFPDDVKSLILDSPISDINKYYINNTSNYVSSLNNLFKSCQDDPECNAEYPYLEDIYYEVVEDLTNDPITVKVDKSIIEEGTFTYNAEDYKIAIHQALYQKGLIEVLPLLIYQFHNRNEDALSALVAAFSGALGLDYGMYYCVTCNEAIPKNSIEEYENDSSKHPKLKGGLSFYNSDFAVCNRWNNQISTDTIEEYLAADTKFSTLIFTGDYDPITPSTNGVALDAKINNSTLLNAGSNGHASSFTLEGFEVANKFINAPSTKVSYEESKSNEKINFVENVYVNGGASNLGNSINNFDILFFAPLIIALLISIVAIFIFIVGMYRNRTKKNWLTKIIKILLIITSIMGVGVLTGLILALNNTAAINFYILAIGVPESYSYLFPLMLVFFGLLLISCLYFIFSMIKIENRSVIFSVLFSNVLIGVYFLYWGFMS